MINVRAKKSNIIITDDFYCLHGRESKCKCRKPNTKLIENAVAKHNIDTKVSFFIGDKTSDILAGKRLGMKTILVLTGKAGKDGMYDVKPDYICQDLYDASIKIEECP